MLAAETYRDIEETGLLTVEEYAASANEKPADVRLRLAIAGLIIEFLNAVGRNMDEGNESSL